jgi:hypothetical protein
MESEQFSVCQHPGASFEQRELTPHSNVHDKSIQASNINRTLLVGA